MLMIVRAVPVVSIVSLAFASAPLFADPVGPVAPSVSAHPDDQGEAMEHVRVETGLDRGSMTPGGAATIGVRFVIEDGWHLYWRNNGDSGMPIGVTFEAPEGVRLGAIQWPAPERYVYGIDSVDYIYTREVALLAPIEIDERFSTGDRVEIRASFELLACERACVVGMGARSIVIDIAESTAMREPEWMKKSRAKVPGRDRSSLQVRWDGTDLLISVYGIEGINGLTFFPYAPAGLPPVDPFGDGTGETGSLRIAYPPAIVGAPRVAGVLEINTRMSGGPHWIEIETTPPSEPTNGGHANEPTPPPASQPPPAHPIKNRSGD